MKTGFVEISSYWSVYTGPVTNKQLFRVDSQAARDQLQQIEGESGPFFPQESLT
jgi:hypothetical protein